jgi:hypothetical protein
VLAILNEQHSNLDNSEVEAGGDDAVGKANISIEYLACIAKFDSYEGADGQQVRYLVSVDYYGRHGMTKTPASLLQFFDEDQKADGKDEGAAATDTLDFGPIAAVAIGCGIESDEDVTQIETFFKHFTQEPIPMETVRPNSEFATMKEETAAYKAMDADGKEQSKRLQSMGPGKMAQFTLQLAQRILNKAVTPNANDDIASPLEQEAAPQPNHAAHQSQEPESTTNTTLQQPAKEIDPEKNRYSCRRCRTVLFGEIDLEAPPHVPSSHRFSYRKIKHEKYGLGVSSTTVGKTSDSNEVDPCQSLFLQAAMDWMGGDIQSGAAEGKFTCDACDAKLGNWNWSGAQCSCGTWVVPAIQVPRSKVDVVPPRQPDLPDGTVVSPFATIMMQQQLQQLQLQPE